MCVHVRADAKNTACIEDSTRAVVCFLSNMRKCEHDTCKPSKDLWLLDS